MMAAIINNPMKSMLFYPSRVRLAIATPIVPKMNPFQLSFYKRNLNLAAAGRWILFLSLFFWSLPVSCWLNSGNASSLVSLFCFSGFGTWTGFNVRRNHLVAPPSHPKSSAGRGGLQVFGDGGELLQGDFEIGGDLLGDDLGSRTPIFPRKT